MTKLKFEEVTKQEYKNCSFSTGFVKNHPVDTMYLKLERPPEKPIVIVLRPDEMAAIAWVTSGTLWSHEMTELDKKDA